MPPELPRRRKLAELPSHHVLGHIHRDELLAVMHRERMPNELGQNGGTPRQVRTTFFSLLSFIAVTFFTRWSSVSGPFFNDLLIIPSPEPPAPTSCLFY